MTTVPEGFPDRVVAIMGLGYVGLTLATVMVEVGFEVHGIEIRDDLLSGLRAGKAHFSEPGISQRLTRAVDRGRLKISKKIPPACPATVFIITVGTPMGPNGRARMDMVESVAHEVGRHLKDGDLVIMRSTVKIGTTRELVRPILAQSGKRFELAFCPERTVEGQALEELRWLPQIVGAESLSTSVRAAQLFQFLTPTVVRVRDTETAEMIKLIDNAQRDVHFAYANEVARLCDAVGISAAEVIQAGKRGYPRTNLPMPGPVGGPCLEKDSYILAESVERHGIKAEMTLAARHINERQATEAVAHLRAVAASLSGFPAAPVVSLLGIAFKGQPPTDDLRGTTARPIFAALRQAFPDGRFRSFDPMVGAEAQKAFGVEPMASIEAALSGAHLAVILNNHRSFGQMPIETLAEVMAAPAVVYDLWNNFDPASLMLPEGRYYMALGSHGLTPLRSPRPAA
ncbi:MAG: nucleotide sugar dehydrogenase [Proteobacteria bacterium]|nr:nucleotide sugar dehydrogenase [Pseudomonadota bacterium]